MADVAQPKRGGVWLLDAHNLLYRYHHAMPRVEQDGRQVQGVRGLRALVSRIWLDWCPASVGVVFDAGDSGRSLLSPNYKAGRAETPDEIRVQIEMAHTFLPILRAHACDVIRCDGFEADDVIATLAGRARQAGHPVYIVTRDKDLMALVTDEAPEVALYDRPVGRQAVRSVWQIYQEAGVQARLLVPPARVLDLLALAGDSVDNVAGVPGIGPKTAANLLLRFGSLQALLEGIGSLKQGATRQNLRAHVAEIQLARQLLAAVPIPTEALAAGTRKGRK
jgi:DNA polymerase-1